jgi:hypothetical protein
MNCTRRLRSWVLTRTEVETTDDKHELMMNRMICWVACWLKKLHYSLRKIRNRILSYKLIIKGAITICKAGNWIFIKWHDLAAIQLIKWVHIRVMDMINRLFSWKFWLKCESSATWLYQTTKLSGTTGRSDSITFPCINAGRTEWFCTSMPCDQQWERLIQLWYLDLFTQYPVWTCLCSFEPSL